MQRRQPHCLRISVLPIEAASGNFSKKLQGVDLLYQLYWRPAVRRPHNNQIGKVMTLSTKVTGIDGKTREDAAVFNKQ